jgi:glycosyltransferase involved in cell wall biosynthesis
MHDIVEAGRTTAPLNEPRDSVSQTVSFVIPVFDEVECIGEFHRQLAAAVSALGRDAEVLYVDDGSTDGTSGALDQIVASCPWAEVAHMRRNYGKSAALDLGFRMARGAVVFTLDADLQDDPAEIPRFLLALSEGNDVVSGWKKLRHDPIGKTLPSLVFNWFTRAVSGLQIHDFNSGFKAYRREALTDLRLYGELHRYIPVLLHWEGFRVCEIEVAHRPRFAGKSKFGARRLLNGAFDLLTVILTSRFRNRPLHFFGYIAVVLGALGSLMLGWLFALSIFEVDPLRPRPMLYASMMMISTAALLIATGLLGELIKSLLPHVPDYRTRPGTAPRTDRDKPADD